ncbi:hypothetical protein [Nocardiopsis baichengensis]|uniref:hypothetical protein n=1 Tax=Nocardiopsis baichengensis TaxID=280240 RepID=UPI0003499366|nr:hypothetical protein [Nocardiopsis baichengensis]
MHIPRRPFTAVGAAALTAATALTAAPAASADEYDSYQTYASAALAEADLLPNEVLGTSSQGGVAGGAGSELGSDSADGTARGSFADYMDVTGRTSVLSEEESGSTSVTLDEAHILVTTGDLADLGAPAGESPDAPEAGEGAPVIDVEVTGLEAATSVDTDGKASSELTVEGIRAFGEEVAENGRARTEVEVDGEAVEITLRFSTYRSTQDIGEREKDVAIAKAGVHVIVLADGQKIGWLDFGETYTNTRGFPEPGGDGGSDEDGSGDGGDDGGENGTGGDDEDGRPDGENGENGEDGEDGGATDEDGTPGAGSGDGGEDSAGGPGAGSDNGADGADDSTGDASDGGSSAADGSTLPMTGVALAGLVVVGAAAAAVGAMALQGSRSRRATNGGESRTA